MKPNPFTICRAILALLCVGLIVAASAKKPKKLAKAPRPDEPQIVEGFSLVGIIAGGAKEDVGKGVRGKKPVKRSDMAIVIDNRNKKSSIIRQGETIKGLPGYKVMTIERKKVVLAGMGGRTMFLMHDPFATEGKSGGGGGGKQPKDVADSGDDGGAAVPLANEPIGEAPEAASYGDGGGLQQAFERAEPVEQPEPPERPEPPEPVMNDQ